MNVLWVVNEPLPEAISLLRGVQMESNSTGSWKCALADAIETYCGDIILGIAAPYSEVKNFVELKGRSATHFIFPHGKDDLSPVSEIILDEIYKSFNPDIVHIHGTEYGYGLSFLNRFADRTVVSIQGLISEIFSCYYGGISKRDIIRYISVRDIIRMDTIPSQKRRMKRRADFEKDIIRSAKYVIGRTGWDCKISKRLSPSVCYYHCDEMLREPFYSGEWHYETCIPHRIFVSQGYYPLKGLHKLIEAMPTVLTMYPDTIIRISGPNVLRGEGLMNRLLLNGYGKYIRQLIKRYHLIGKIQFIGPCNAEKVKEEMLLANVFISPSMIENSSNSICEAQMLGVPIIASEVGGTSTLIPNEQCGILYNYDDIDSLSEHVIDVFSLQRIDMLEEKQIASKRHNKQTIINQLTSIYDDISK